MKKQLIISSFLIIPLLSIAQKPGYYNGTEGKTGEELKTALHNIIDEHIDFSYSDAKYILNYADEDPANSNNMILFYTKRSQSKTSWGSGGNDANREHVWAKSHGNFEDVRPMDGDAFNLHPADASTNILKSNYDFDECSDFGTYIEEADAYYQSPRFEPSDAAKGEVARTIFYMSVRYEGTNNEMDLEVADEVNTYPTAKHGKLATLLEWNRDFPPTDLERRRNERVFEAQRNRNPFIDHPEFADMIWGGASAPAIVIENLHMSEDYPYAGTTVQISADINNITTASLYHGSYFNSEDNSAILSASGNTWTADFELITYAPGDLVYYKIIASDGSEDVTLMGSYMIPVEKALTDISAIQGTGDSTPMSGSTVTVGGIVTANFDNTYSLQNGTDPRNGIVVYGIKRGQIGDSIVVTGRAVEYNNLTEIDNTSYTYVFKTETPVESAVITLAEANEDYEGSLVTFNNVIFLEGDTDIPVDQAATFHLSDGVNSLNVYSRYNSRLGGNILPSGTVNVTGVLVQFQGDYQLLINSIDDIKIGEDNDPPLLTGVVVNDASWIELSFSEKIDKTSAETISNYVFSDGLQIAGAYLYNGTKVLLLVSGLKQQEYTITVSNVSDLQGNAIIESSLNFTSPFGSNAIQDYKAQEFILWPNPTSNQLNFKVSGLNSGDKIKVKIISTEGKILYQEKMIYKNNNTMNLSGFEDGLYILQLSSDTQIIQKAFNLKK